MGFHLPSFLIGSSIAGCGFLLINRELSHRHRLTTKWALQEYAEKEWKEWRKSSLEKITDATKVSNFVLSDVSIPFSGSYFFAKTLTYIKYHYLITACYLILIVPTWLQKNITQIPDPSEATTAVTSNWNRGISSLRELLSQKKE